MIGLTDIIFIFIAVIGFITFYFKRSYKYWEKKNVPYIQPSVPWGTNENPMKATKSFGVRAKDFYEEFKSKGYSFVGMYLITKPALLVIDRDLIRSVLSKDFQYFTGHGIHVDEKKNPISGNLFSLDGEKWRNMRIKLTPAFTSGKMKMMFNTLLACSEPMIDHINMLSDQGKPLNIKEALACFTTDVIGSCAFGIECNSFKNPDAEFRKYGRKLFQTTWKTSLYRLLNLIIPRLRLSNTDKETRHFFVNSFKNIVIYREKERIKRNDFVQLLLEINEKAKSTGSNDTLSVEQMTAQSIMFFAAGFETSSTTMTFCLHELSFNLDIQEKLRAEIKKTMEQNDGKLTYDGVMGMKYLNMVVDETLRKYPPGVLINRLCNKNYKIAETGIEIEAGTRVFVSIFGLHRDPEYFPNPEKFDPERFSDENKARIPHFTYLPFGEGPRICIGLRFGLMQTKVGLCLLLKNFIFTPHKSARYDMEFHKNSIVLSFKDDPLLTIKRIN